MELRFQERFTGSFGSFRKLKVRFRGVAARFVGIPEFSWGVSKVQVGFYVSSGGVARSSRAIQMNSGSST